MLIEVRSLAFALELENQALFFSGRNCLGADNTKSCDRDAQSRDSRLSTLLDSRNRQKD